jgi:hypothetical protein
MRLNFGELYRCNLYFSDSFDNLLFQILSVRYFSITFSNFCMLLPLVSFRKLLVYSCLVGICSILAPTLQAQEGEGSSPLELGRRIVPDVIGIVAGPGFYAQDGFINTECGCTFTNGVGAGIVAGVMYEKNLLAPNANWRLGTINIGARLLYEERNIGAAFREYEPLPIKSLEPPFRTYTVPILMRYLAEANFTMLTLTPYIVWNPFTISIFQPFVQVGFQVGYTLNARLRNTKFILDGRTRLPNDEDATVTFDSTNKRFDPLRPDRLVVQDSTFTQGNLNALQIAASVSVGTDIPLGTRFRLSPMLNLLLPLTKMVEERVTQRTLPNGTIVSNLSNGSFSITSWQILVALKMNLER